MKIRTKVKIDDPRFEPLALSLIADGLPQGARLIQQVRNTIVAVRAEGVDVNIKEFKVPAFPNSIIYGHLRKTKARRSYEYAKRLISVGIMTPQPIGYIEIYVNGRLGRSYYLSVQEDSLTEFRNAQGDDRLKIAQSIGHEIARFRSHKIWFKDFSPGNILYRPNHERTGWEFMYVDLNRMAFGTDDEDKFILMFRNLTNDPKEIATAARAYAESAGLDSDLTVERALQSHAKFADEGRRKQRLKRLAGKQ